MPEKGAAPWPARAALLLAVVGCGAACASRTQPGVMSWEEYAGRSIQWPYVLRIDRSPGSLMYFGARHTYTARDDQVDQIEKAWASFRPTIAFNEGGHPPIEGSRDVAVAKYGEAGLVRFLAARDDVPVTSLDPDRAEEVAHLRKVFAPGEVKLFFVLRSVAQFVDRAGVDGVDAELQRVLAILNAAPGLGASPRSIAEVASSFAERFPDHAGYAHTPLRWFDPTRSETFLNRVSRASSEYRDRAMVMLLSKHVLDGQRVLAVVGGTHVVMQEKALSAALRAKGRRPSDGRN